MTGHGLKHLLPGLLMNKLADEPSPSDAVSVDRSQLEAMLTAATSCLHTAMATLEVAMAAVKGVQEELSRGALKTLPVCNVPRTDHRAAHRPSRPPKIDTDPELRAFITARIDRLTFIEIADAVAKHFPPARRVGKTAIYDWWKRNYRPKRKVPNGSD